MSYALSQLPTKQASQMPSFEAQAEIASERRTEALNDRQCEEGPEPMTYKERFLSDPDEFSSNCCDVLLNMTPDEMDCLRTCLHIINDIDQKPAPISAAEKRARHRQRAFYANEAVDLLLNQINRMKETN